MRFKVFVLLAMGLGVFLAAAPMLAHHSFMAEFDMSKSIVVKGTVTKVAWANPHIAFYVDVTDDSGKVTNWSVDAAAPSALAGRGWTRTSLKAGDVITVEGFAAKSGKPQAAASMVTLADGRKVFAGSDGAYPR